MSDTMLHIILQMLPELWTNDAIDIAQRHGRYLEASKRIAQLKRERDEARRELDEARKKLDDSDTVMKWSASKVEELNESLIRLVKERDEAIEELKVWRQLNVLIAKLKEEAK